MPLRFNWATNPGSTSRKNACPQTRVLRVQSIFSALHAVRANHETVRRMLMLLLISNE